MTEEEWVSSENLANRSRDVGWRKTSMPQRLIARIGGAPSRRKWFLMGTAFARTCEPIISHPDAGIFIWFCEEHAEGTLSDDDRELAVRWMWQFANGPQITSVQYHCARVLIAVMTDNPGVWGANGLEHILQVHRSREERKPLCNLIRDIFGNPFRPVTFPAEWRSEAAAGIAAKMYESREFGNMPVLADALQDAGCEHPDVLAHCREPGTHVRGCWVVDLVLGKS